MMTGVGWLVSSVGPGLDAVGTGVDAVGPGVGVLEVGLVVGPGVGVVAGTLVGVVVGTSVGGAKRLASASMSQLVPVVLVSWSWHARYFLSLAALLACSAVKDCPAPSADKGNKATYKQKA